MSMTNPLLSRRDYPAFDLIKVEHIEPALKTILAENRAELQQIKGVNHPDDLAEVLSRFDRLNARLAEAWASVSHLNAVMNSDSLRAAFNICLPLISDYETELNQDADLFKLYQRLEAEQQTLGLTLAERQAVTNALRDFRLSGVDLQGSDRTQFGALKQRLNENTTLFAEHILDATDAWHLLIQSEERLDGLPSNVLAQAAQAAKHNQQDGFRFDLSAPSYLGVMTYAEDRALRQEVYLAFVTRASEIGPHGGQFDNTALMGNILKDRLALANLVGFERYSGLSLATKMAKSPAEVTEFLKELAARSKPVAQRDFDEIAGFALEHLGLEQLEPWDIAFCAERLKQSRF